MKRYFIFLLIIIAFTRFSSRSWELSDYSTYQIDYIQLNFDHVPTTIPTQRIMNFKDSINKKIKLIDEEKKILKELITNKKYWSNADCGTFHLNAGFIIYENNKPIASINIGCGFNQWNFNPDNSATKAGSLNDTGFHKMTILLDKINKRMKK